MFKYKAIHLYIICNFKSFKYLLFVFRSNYYLSYNINTLFINKFFNKKPL